jgi:hypothetical protein
MAQINKPSEYFNTKLYTGNGSTQSITGVGFQPDFTWIKERNNAHDASIMDVVRGVRKSLTPSNTEVEYTETTGLSSWDSDGFSFDGAGFDHVNTSGDSFVAWNWLANGAGVSNTDGSITSTVSANTTSGFSIVSYTGNGTSGATVGHGLGITPKMIIVKNRSAVTQWQVYHITTGGTASSQLSGTGTPDTASSYWNNTSPNSTFFTLGTVTPTNGSGNSMIAYCFAEKKGFSKFGSYVGNGSTNGTFVYTGFKPAFIMIKNTTVGDGWQLIDAKRNVTNGYNNSRLEANNANAESVNNTWTLVDLLSNGFKQRYTDNIMNASGSTYIYMAFAENPLVGTNDIPTTAR